MPATKIATRLAIVGLMIFFIGPSHTASAQEYSLTESHAPFEGEAAFATADGIPIYPAVSMDCEVHIRTYPRAGMAAEIRYKSPSGSVINNRWFEQYTTVFHAVMSTDVYSTGTYTCEAEFYYEGYYLGTDDAPSRVYLKEFDITINTFIPGNYVTKPFDSDRVYTGDDRGFSRDGGSRTHQVVGVYAPRADLSNHVKYSIRSSNESAEYETATSLGGDDRLTSAALNDFALGPPMKIRWDTGSMSGQCLSSRVSASILDVRCTGDGNNPLFDWGGVNDISYDFNVRLSLPGGSSENTFTVTGYHDGFPNYEMYIGDQQIFAYSHGSQTPFSLGPPMEWSAYNFGVIW